MRQMCRWLALLLMATSAAWSGGGVTASAETSCPETKIHLSGDHDDGYVIPALERGEVHQGRDIDGEEVVGSCTAEGLEVQVNGKLVAVYSEDKVRVPGDDGEEVVIYRGRDERGHIVVSSRGEEDLTIDLREDGVVLVGGTDSKVMKLVIDRDGEALSLRIE